MQRLRVTCTMVALSVIALGDSVLGSAEPARAVKITVLSTMLAGNPGRGIGEWGFAAPRARRGYGIEPGRSSWPVPVEGSPARRQRDGCTARVRRVHHPD